MGNKEYFMLRNPEELGEKSLKHAAGEEYPVDYPVIEELDILAPGLNVYRQGSLVPGGCPWARLSGL